MTSPATPQAAVPTEEERAKAFELSEMPPRTNTALIAQALATARTKGEAAGLEEAAAHCEQLQAAVPDVGVDVPSMITRGTYASAARSIRTLKETP